ncbi:hypothetical protein [Sphingobacterium daejeonense]|nr:hypothetical protein [Sphingobacterium daejeonense]VTQ08568.1 Uncharacterised protein [Sphingobacterium daejeonense]
MNEEFLDLSFPKTTGPELFNLEYLNNALKENSFTKPES